MTMRIRTFILAVMLLATSVLQAQKEIVVYGEKTQHMFALVRELYAAKDEQSFSRLYDRIEKGEEGSDRMENEIGRYLGDLGSAHLSDDTKEMVRAMLRQIGELESVGDSCFNLARILRRKRSNKIEFTEQQNKGIQEMFSLVGDALTRMNELLSGTYSGAYPPSLRRPKSSVTN